MPEETPFHEHGGEIEKLSKAIVEAIVRSEEVQEAMRKIIETDGVGLNAHMVMMLKLDGLVKSLGLIDGDDTDTPEITPLDVNDIVGGLSLRDVNKGDELSEAELAFREYLAKTFDEDDWLKRNRLIF